MKIRILLLILFLTTISNAQNYWNKITPNNQKSKTETYKEKKLPKIYQLFSLDINSFTVQLNSISKGEEKFIYLPNSMGRFTKFRVNKMSNFEKKLASKFPNIKSYVAQDVIDKTTIANISLGLDGIHILITSGKQSTLYIDPFTKNNRSYIVYKKEDFIEDKASFNCLSDSVTNQNLQPKKIIEKSNTLKSLKVFRMALVCSAEYAQYHIARQGVPEKATDHEKKAAVLSAMNTSLTRINSVFIKDVGVKMILSANNDDIIFLDKENDNITEGNPIEMISESQTICDTVIGDTNYDIGHLFSISGDGLAGLEVVCITGLKGRGVTGRENPLADPYDIDYVAHEIGHQFGATHTQNSNCNRTNRTAVEPGSGSTIMGYAGICLPDIQANSDAYFNAVNIAQIKHTLINTASCATNTITNNNVPTANAGFDVSIPRSTPFVLKGRATDIDGEESLTYSWEQIDYKVAMMPPVSTNANGPLFRSLPPKIYSERYFPSLSTVIAGAISNEWEVIPSVAREMSFAFTVRDNHINSGATARDDIKITVTNANPFQVTSQSTNETWNVGSQQNITWNNTTTNEAPINCKYVRIKLSTNGGLTFPFLLAESTPNDGNYSVTIPNLPTANARIIIEAIDNVFYAVNKENFVISSTEPTFILSNVSGAKSICIDADDEVIFTINADFINDFNEVVVFEITDLPDQVIASFSPKKATETGNTILTISGLKGIAAKNYKPTIIGSSSSVNQSKTIDFTVFNANFSNVLLLQPVSESVNINSAPILLWEKDSNAISYELEIALASSFDTIILETTSFTNSYNFTSALDINTNYYWRVKPKNSCGVGVYSKISTFRTTIPQYCNSTFTHDIGGSEHITNVHFNTINNTSENDKVDGYEDFTAVSTDVKQGDNHQIKVTFDTGGFQDHCFVFVDWNQDLEFNNTTEKYDLGSKSDDIATAIYNISVPEDAILGNTRMRIVIEYDDPKKGFGEGACDTKHKTEWGETEDYTIKVLENTATASSLEYTFEKMRLFPNPSKGTIRLTFKKRHHNLVSIKLFTVSGQLIETKEFSNTNDIFSEELAFKKVNTGLYFLQITNGGFSASKKIIIQ